MIRMIALATLASRLLGFWTRRLLLRSPMGSVPLAKSTERKLHLSSWPRTMDTMDTIPQINATPREIRLIVRFCCGRET